MSKVGKIAGSLLLVIFIIFGLFITYAGAAILLFSEEHVGVVANQTSEGISPRVNDTYNVSSEGKNYSVMMPGRNGLVQTGDSITFWALEGSNQGSISKIPQSLVVGPALLLIGFGVPIALYIKSARKAKA